jgi:diacylglycerol kinase (ATP)
MLRFLKSVRFALRGLRFSLHEQLNIKIQIAFALAVIGLAFYLSVDRMEWVALLICIGLVISLEMINTALEDLVDLVSPQFNPVAGKIKDIAAAAVLFASVIAAIVGSIIFYPYFFN